MSAPDLTWIEEATARVAVDPAAIRTLFPAAGRHAGRAPVRPDDPDGLRGGTLDDRARARLLAALPLAGDALVTEVTDLYRYGDAAEKRGVLRALPALDVGDRLVPLLHDALRSNDTRLLAAALGPYARHLDAHTWRHGVLKCLFSEVPLAVVHGLADRADPELHRMVDAYAAERRAAGRTVSPDALDLLGNE